MDNGAFPPEIDSARMHASPASDSLLAASVASNGWPENCDISLTVG